MNESPMERLVSFMVSADKDTMKKAQFVAEVVEDLVVTKQAVSRWHAAKLIHDEVQGNHMIGLARGTIKKYDVTWQWINGRGWIKGRTYTEHEGAANRGWSYELLEAERFPVRASGIKGEKAETTMLRGLALISKSRDRMKDDVKHVAGVQRTIRNRIIAIADNITDQEGPMIEALVKGS